MLEAILSWLRSVSVVATGFVVAQAFMIGFTVYKMKAQARRKMAVFEKAEQNIRERFGDELLKTDGS